ncbi:hypothetical protein K7H91_12225 [Martelella mediterranea]|nr:hypothetical protein [Martelella mediterranea]
MNEDDDTNKMTKSQGNEDVSLGNGSGMDARIDDVLAVIDEAARAAYTVTAKTPPEVAAEVLTDDQLADLERYEAEQEAGRASDNQALDEALADFVNEDAPEPAKRNPAIEAWRQSQADEIAKNKAHGHTAQAFDAIDEHRKTLSGKALYNANRRTKRQQEALAEGRDYQTRRTFISEEQRAQTKLKAKRAYRARQRADFLALSPEEQERIRLDKARKRKEQRARKKEDPNLGRF